MSKFMLAHRTDLGVLSRTDVVGQVKEDGTRNHIIKSPTSLEMWSRDSRTNDYGVNYAEVHNLPEVEADVRKLDCKSIWLDVELVWYNKHGRSIMRGSQVRCGTKKPDKVQMKMRVYPINAVIFDLLELDGEDFTDQPYIVRQTMLEAFMEQQRDLKSLMVLPYTTEKRELWARMLDMGSEGIMCKTLMHTYQFRRSRDWLKLKNEKLTDGKKGRPPPMEVVGYTAGKNARSRFFGSLVMRNPTTQEYAGNVGGGFNKDELETWTEILEKAPGTEKPFSEQEVGDAYVAVKVPHRVIVRYFEVTDLGKLRFPVYLDIAKV